LAGSIALKPNQKNAVTKGEKGENHGRAFWRGGALPARNPGYDFRGVQDSFEAKP
jgi:hypothetical protein